MRAVPCVILLVCLAVGLGGCQSANKRQSGGGDSSPFAPTGSKNKGIPSAPKDPIFDSDPGTAPDVGGILAGQVVDGLTGRPIDANIHWVCLDDKEEGPFDVDARPKGYFTIEGLKPGKHYKLTAKAKNGERALAGVQYTVAPNPRVVIKLKDELAAPGGPPPPAPPRTKSKDGKPADPPQKSTGGTGERPAVAEAPGWEPTVAPVAVPQPHGRPGLGTPVPLGADAGAPSWATNPIPPPPPPPPLRPERIVVTGPKGPPPMVVPPQETGRPVPVPSCVYVGRQLKHLALPELSGQPWEYPRQKRGKLMLLDFWGTGCEPCLKAIPQLRAFQDRYGAAGLEVVGIAYEHGGTPAEQAQRVRVAAERHQINYRLLLGGPRCPARAQFDVNLLPTLVLITPHGWVEWRHEGRLEPHHLGDLERRIKTWLGTN